MVGGMETDARDMARRYYSRSNRCLQADMAALALNPRALIYWTPRLVALAKPVLSSCPADWPRLQDAPEGADGWYIHLLTGDLQWARRLAQHTPQLRWLCFQRGLRGRRPHILPWRRILPH